jgi:hypothetical protein
MQKMFHSTQFLETLNKDVSKMVPFYDTMSSALRSAYKNYEANTNNAYIRMSGGAMQLLNAEVTIRRKRIEEWVLVSQVDIIKLLYKSAQKYDGNMLHLFGSEIIGLTQNIAKDHIQLNLEIEERELAMILLHFQNDIIRGPSNEGQEIKPLYDLNLVSYPNFLNQYHLDKNNGGFSKYFSVIAIKMMNIMLLNFISNTPVGAGFPLGGGRRNKKQIGGGNNMHKLSSKSKRRPSSVKTISGGSSIVPKRRSSSSSVSLSKRK